MEMAKAHPKKADIFQYLVFLPILFSCKLQINQYDGSHGHKY